jgi:hypothetical protein
MTDLTSGASSCVSDAALAAYAEGRLPADERQRIEAHVAACEDCYLLLAGVVQTEDDLTAERPAPGVTSRPDERPAPGRVIPFHRRKGLLAAAAVLSAAAAVVLFVMSRGGPLDPLVSAVGTQRLTLARPTGGFEYGELRSALRNGAPEGAGDLRLAAAAAELRERSASGEPADVHAWGVAQLVLGQADASAQTLASAVASAPERAEYHADLGAAQLTLYLQRRDPADAAAALASVTRALAIDPGLREALFNRALVLEALGRRQDAIAAWDEYLARDPDSPWAGDARGRRAALE